MSNPPDPAPVPPLVSLAWLAEYEAAAHHGDESSVDSLRLVAAYRKLLAQLDAVTKDRDDAKAWAKTCEENVALVATSLTKIHAYDEIHESAVAAGAQEGDCVGWMLFLQHERKRLLAGKFTPEEIHNICHNLHGTVNAEEFAEGCRKEMEKLYGECPWTKRLEKLEQDVWNLQVNTGPSMIGGGE